jgi:hypothetical protein
MNGEGESDGDGDGDGGEGEGDVKAWQRQKGNYVLTGELFKQGLFPR